MLVPKYGICVHVNMHILYLLIICTCTCFPFRSELWINDQLSVHHHLISQIGFTSWLEGEGEFQESHLSSETTEMMLVRGQRHWLTWRGRIVQSYLLGAARICITLQYLCFILYIHVKTVFISDTHSNISYLQLFS